LGAATDLSPAQVRWLSPLMLWTGILAGPVAWAADLTASYALVKPACARGSSTAVMLMTLMTLLALAVIAAGGLVSWTSLRYSTARGGTDGGRPIERARFMAVLGLTSSAFFVIATIALDIPRWVLDACY